MNFEKDICRPKPDDVLTIDEYQVLQRAQQGELSCPGCEATLNGFFYFDVIKGRQMKGVRLSCPGCGFHEI